MMKSIAPDRSFSTQEVEAAVEHLDAGLRIHLAEILQRAGDEERTGERQQAEPDAAAIASARSLDLLDRALKLAHRQAHPPGELGRRVGGRHPAGGALEQRPAQDALELASRAMDRGLRHLERAGRRGKRAVLGNGQQGPHLRPAELALEETIAGGAGARNVDAQLGQRLVELGEQPCRTALQDLSGFGQIATGVAPAEQRSSDLVLESGDGLGDRGLRHVDGSRGATDILRPRHGLEYQQLTKAWNRLGTHCRRG